jgi:hypothetical protein
VSGLAEQGRAKDEVIRKLKKKVVSSYIKERIWNNQLGNSNSQGEGEELEADEL